MRLLEDLPKFTVRQGVSLKNFTSFKIGGEARSFFFPYSVSQLRTVIRKLSTTREGFYILGRGSNLLINDSPLRKPVIKLGRGFDYISKLEGNLLEVGAATSFSKLLAYCLKEKLGGLERLGGIPGSVGGVVVMNASSFGGEFSSFVEEVEVLDKEGEEKVLKKKEIDFRYRDSSLKKMFVTKVKIKLFPKENVEERFYYFLSQRLKKQDWSFPSAGSIFKNPSFKPAAFLIESCGLKGKGKGDVQVSPKHANFIINRGGGKAKDVVYLIELIKEKVYKKWNVLLEEEIIRWEI